jgi:hypothetical protein
LYAAWIKIDETLPWIELKGEYLTRGEAKKATEKILKGTEIKIVKLGVKKEPMKTLVVAKVRR